MASQAGGDTSGGGGSGGGGGGPLGSDPSVLMALNMQTTGNAQIDAMLKSLRERAIIAFGDPNITGVGFDLDPATKAQTQANYDSGNATLARLAHSNDLARTGIINGLAAHGILRSGDLGYREAEQGRAYGNQTYDARQTLIDYLTKGAQDALDRKNALLMAVNNAYLGAYSNGYSGGGGSGGGGGGGGNIEAPGGWGGNDPASISDAARALAAQRGWGAPTGAANPEIMNEGQVFTDESGRKYVNVKFGTPGGNSTERVYVTAPSAPASSGGGGGAPAPAPAPAPVLPSGQSMPLDAYGFPDFTKPWG